MDGLTVTEFAQRQRVSRAAVYLWMAATPDLPVRRIGGLRILTAADQQRILRRPRKKMGRPKKVIDSASSVA